MAESIEPSGEKSKCAVQRIGAIVDMKDGTAMIDVEGKIVRVPAAKLAEGLSTGDTVKWDGGLWVGAEAVE